MKLTNKKINVRNILIVDDEDSVRQLLGRLLNAEGYNVFEAVHCIDALDKLNMTKIDMVITDLSIIWMYGRCFTKALRNRLGSMSIPVVIMATRLRRHMKLEDYRVCEWLLKPLLYQQLADTANRYST